MPKKITLLAVFFTLIAACSPGPVNPTATGVPVVSSTSVPPTATEAPPPTATSIPEPTATAIPPFIAYDTPDWFDGGVLYEIYVRSFADSDGDGIGDFNGITERMDYIASLHVDVVWLMPIHPSPSVHGYDVTDFFAVNPDYGTMEDFQDMVAAFHAHGIRVIIDFVASHLSNQNPLFKDAYGNPDSVYADWFHFTNDAHTSYQAFADLSSLPRFNHFNPEVVQYLTDAALFWLDLDGDGDYTDGIDGFRVDNAIFPPKEFFVDLRQSIKRVNPDALLLGEVWVETVPELTKFFPDEFDALFNFPLLSFFETASVSNDTGRYEWGLPPSLLTRRLEDAAAAYPAEAIVVQFASNHDTDRLGSVFGGDLAVEKFAAAVTVALPEAFALYYGEEIGMLGVKGGPPHYDSYRREPLDWYAGLEGPGQATWFNVPDSWNRPNDGISVEEEESDPDSLLNTYRQLLELRAELPALRGGEASYPDVLSVGRKGWAIVRTSGSQVLVGIYNFGGTEVEITVADFPFDSAELIDLISGTAYPGSTAGGDYVITLPPTTAVWFVNSSK